MIHDLRGYYIGADDALKGEHALLETKGNRVLAQFDRHETGLGYGWHPYPPEDFFIYGLGSGFFIDGLLFDVMVRRKYTNGLALAYVLRDPRFSEAISPREGSPFPCGE